MVNPHCPGSLIAAHISNLKGTQSSHLLSQKHLNLFLTPAHPTATGTKAILLSILEAPGVNHSSSPGPLGDMFQIKKRDQDSRVNW